MEEAIARLLKVTVSSTLKGTWTDAEDLVNDILNEGHLALHPETKKEIIDYIKTL